MPIQTQLHPPSLYTLKTAISVGRSLTLVHKGERIEVDPHAVINAERTKALVLVAWVPSLGERGFFRFAEIRGVEFLSRSFTPRPDAPRFCRVRKQPRQSKVDDADAA
jgi:hypothetical protein